MPTVEEALERAKAAIRAQGRAQPGETADEARKRAAEQVKAQKRLIDTSQNVVKRLTGMDDSNGNADNSASLKKQGERPVKFKHIEMILDLIAHPTNRNFQQLAGRIAALESVPQLTDGGIWNAEKVISRATW